MLPTVFLSHGAPTLVFEDIPARQFIADLGTSLPRPKAILCVSAHWETAQPAVSGSSSPETIHDFYGFPDALYRLNYPAPGAPALAKRVAELVEGVEIDPDQGLDHGAWNPLMLAYPRADIPVAQLSIQVPAGTPSTLASVRPANICPTACPASLSETSFVATTAPMPKNGPCARPAITRLMSSTP